jgi:mono/diheme cytochrome c family protein
MAISRATGLLAAAASVVLAGCGAGPGAQSLAGRAVFAQDCAACHSLTGTESPRLQGGDLLSFRSSRTQLTELAGEMPVRHALNRSELRSVVSFVMSAEDRRR